MRPIKFRGKRVDTGEWIYGDLLTSNGTECEISDWDKVDYFRYDVIPETISQFTGLLDKNGKEIYEGDFVEWCFFDCQQREHFLRGNIKWHQGGFILNITENDFENAGYYAISDLSTDTESDVEILGNVHDNPELLKGGKPCI